MECEKDWETIIAYLDKGPDHEDWKFFKKDTNGSLFVYLGNGYCFPIEHLDVG